MMARGFPLLGILAVLLLATATANSATIDVADDTWVREDQPDDNRNGNDQMNARTDTDGDDNDVNLLRFDTSQLLSASGATLNLHWQRSDGSMTNMLKVYGLNETHPDETTWDETTVTYNTAPGLLPDGLDPAAESGAGNTDDDVQDLDAANLALVVPEQPYGPQVQNEVYTFSGAGLDAFLNADTNGEVTFLILRSLGTSGNQARFWPKESGPGAFLGDVTLIPEPSSVVLAAMLGLALLPTLRGKRR